MSKDNTGRIVTLVIEIKQAEYPGWIMAAHMNGPQNGVRVRAIHDGDALDEIDNLTSELEYIERKWGEE